MYICGLLFFRFAGELTRHSYETMRREASCLRIQRDLRMHLARKAYKELSLSAVSIQTGMRGMTARNELRFRKQTRAAILIQVNFFFSANHLRGTIFSFKQILWWFIFCFTTAELLPWILSSFKICWAEESCNYHTICMEGESCS